MAEIKTIYKGESVTLLFTFPEAYDMARLISHKVFVGETEFMGVIDGQTIRMQLKSSDTDRMIGTHRIVCLIDDTTLGLRKPYCGELVIAKTQASGSTTSVSNISDIIIPIVISETAITVGDVLYNYVKGGKGDPFLYSDFTPEQIAELQQPATDAIASIEAVELAVEQAEALRVTAEQARQTNTATAIQNAETATQGANNAASLANEVAGLANNAATLANTKAGLADTAATNANTKAGLADAAATNANNVANTYAAELAGKVKTADLSTQAESEGNTNNTKWMTPLRVFQNWAYNVANYVNSTLTTVSKTIIGAINELKGQTPASMPLQTVANKNQHYPIIENNAGAILGRHQTNYWNGSAWTADNSFGFGNNSLYNNTGANSNGFGNGSLYNNTGANSNGFGYYSLLNNTGANSNGFGNNSLQNNTGANSNGFGNSSLYNNTGTISNGFGQNALRYNQKDNNTAIGDNSYSGFLANLAGNKTADSSAVDITLERITLTAHGFGAVNAIVNIKYASTDGTAIGGLSVGSIYQVKIIDANTVEFITGSQKINLTSQGTGNHTFTPQFAYTNTTCLGANTQPNKDNQVVLGSTAVDTVKMGGTARTIASATATGEKGEMCWDANYLYICVATNTWKRIALSTW